MYRISQFGSEHITEVDTIDQLHTALSFSKPGRYCIDQIESDPLPSGHTSRRWGVAIKRLKPSLASAEIRQHRCNAILECFHLLASGELYFVVNLDRDAGSHVRAQADRLCRRAASFLWGSRSASTRSKGTKCNVLERVKVRMCDSAITVGR